MLKWLKDTLPRVNVRTLQAIESIWMDMTTAMDAYEITLLDNATHYEFNIRSDMRITARFCLAACNISIEQLRDEIRKRGLKCLADTEKVIGQHRRSRSS